jgi:hypothetical protein
MSKKTSLWTLALTRVWYPRRSPLAARAEGVSSEQVATAALAESRKKSRAEKPSLIGHE